MTSQRADIAKYLKKVIDEASADHDIPIYDVVVHDSTLIFDMSEPHEPFDGKFNHYTVTVDVVDASLESGG